MARKEKRGKERRREKEKGVGSSPAKPDLRNLKQLNVNFGFEHAK
jgi:hypothetical protein